jgi:hypothetical protein
MGRKPRVDRKIVAAEAIEQERIPMLLDVYRTKQEVRIYRNYPE